MTETAWSHLGIVAVIVVPLIVIWLDLRHRSGQQHTQTGERLSSIETKIDPLWKWWNKTNGH
jgi:hypothetical protein